MTPTAAHAQFGLACPGRHAVCNNIQELARPFRSYPDHISIQESDTGSRLEGIIS